MLTSTAPPSSSTAARSLPLAQRLAQLPRDTRDTLFLLGLIGWVLLLQLENLPVWCSGLAALVLLWRGILTWRNQPLPSRWWLVILLALTIGATLLTYRTIFGRDAGHRGGGDEADEVVAALGARVAQADEELVTHGGPRILQSPEWKPRWNSPPSWPP